MRHTEPEKIAILEYVKIYGVKNAALHFKVGKRTIEKWNQKYHVYNVPKKKTYSIDKKIEILHYAKENTPAQAAELFGVNQSLVSTWNEEYKIYDSGRWNGKPRAHMIRTMRTYEEKKEIAEYSEEYGIDAAAEKFQIKRQTILYFRRSVIKPRPRNYRRFTDAQKEQILQHASNFGVTNSAYKYDVNPTLIRIWQQRARQK